MITEGLSELIGTVLNNSLRTTSIFHNFWAKAEAEPK